MKIFNIEIKRLEDLKDGTYIVEIRPSNIPLSDLVNHCDIREYNYFIEQDRIDIFNILCLYYPDIMVDYEL